LKEAFAKESTGERQKQVNLGHENARAILFPFAKTTAFNV